MPTPERIIWRDITSYSQKETLPRVPRTYEVDLGIFRITVSRHIHHGPNAWVCHVYPRGLDTTATELANKNLVDAQQEALDRLRGQLLRSLDVLDSLNLPKET